MDLNPASYRWSLRACRLGQSGSPRSGNDPDKSEFTIILLSFNSEKRVDLCLAGCPAAEPLSISVVHISSPYHFRDNHTKVFVSRLIFARF